MLQVNARPAIDTTVRLYPRLISLVEGSKAALFQRMRALSMPPFLLTLGNVFLNRPGQGE
jgi:hypothetical protein